MLRSLFMSLFLGLKHSKDTYESFDDYDHFINKEIISENSDIFHGYISKIDYSIKYRGCIIVLHGISDNRRDFLSNYHFKENMKEDFLYLVPELPGFGESQSTFTKAGCYKMLLLWMKYVKDYYSIDNFIIAGQSFGSTLCLDFYKNMYRNGKLETITTLDSSLIYSFVPEHKKRTSIILDDSEKFKIRKIILYSPFTNTHVAVIEYYSLQWANFILKPIIIYLINREIEFDLTTVSNDLDDLIITVIYTLLDNEVPSSNSEKIKKVLKNARFVKYHEHNHINLFIDNNIWNENYHEIIHGERPNNVSQT